MSILCAITSLLKLVLLIALTGVLASIAAVSRLMEVTISLIHPLTLFLLRQSGKLVIWSVKQSARLTSHAFNKMCTMDCSGETHMISAAQSNIPSDAATMEIMIQEVSPETGTGGTEEAVQLSSSKIEGETSDESVKEGNDTESVKEGNEAEGVIEATSVAEGVTDDGNANEVAPVAAE